MSQPPTRAEASEGADTQQYGMDAVADLSDGVVSEAIVHEGVRRCRNKENAPQEFVALSERTHCLG
jgi:hypothetical protein